MTDRLLPPVAVGVAAACVSTMLALEWWDRRRASSPSSQLQRPATQPERASNVLDLIGNTPLLHIKSLSDATGCTILAKLEYTNPGGSVKDRAALQILEEAERDGLIAVQRTTVIITRWKTNETW